MNKQDKERLMLIVKEYKWDYIKLLITAALCGLVVYSVCRVVNSYAEVIRSVF